MRPSKCSCYSSKWGIVAYNRVSASLAETPKEHRPRFTRIDDRTFDAMDWRGQASRRNSGGRLSDALTGNVIAQSAGSARPPDRPPNRMPPLSLKRSSRSEATSCQRGQIRSYEKSATLRHCRTQWAVRRWQSNLCRWSWRDITGSSVRRYCVASWTAGAEGDEMRWQAGRTGDWISRLSRCIERANLIGTRSADFIRACGHMRRLPQGRHVPCT